ncbi:VOC family protein [Streptomyces sp. NPDC048508]|uniref:VOC family protein n=1 Tax=Streptomyces sp. NPDC048508 TaxID=3365561 RepID=UPI0037164008
MSQRTLSKSNDFPHTTTQATWGDSPLSSRLHHVALSAADLTKSTEFYDAVLSPLGYKRTHTFDSICVWGAQEPEVLLYPTEDSNTSPHRKGRAGLQHLAIEVIGRHIVDDVHNAIIAGGWTVVFPPREYPDYAPGYYAVFVEDPDGSRWEFLHCPKQS